jgi:DNA repair exonuclease SbcCD nuclease subunit
VKLLLFSDLHLDTHFRWAGPDAARVRRRNLRSTLSKIVSLARGLEVDALCCGGDLYENERFAPDTGEFLRATFEALAPLPLFIAPGNHDWFGPASLYHQVNWSENVRVFTDGAFVPVEIADGFTLWGAGHRAPANTPDLLRGFRVDRGGVNVALFHGSEGTGFSWQGEGKVAHAPFGAEEILRAGFVHALLGHYHRPTDGPTHTYPGNPDPLEFGEDGDRGAVLLTFHHDGTVDRARHQVATSVVEGVTVDVDGVSHTDQARDVVRQVLATRRGFVRLDLVGEISPDVDLEPSEFTTAAVAPHLDALVLRFDKVRPAYDFETLSCEPTVRGQFVRDVMASSDLGDDERRRVLVTGLRALAGHDDLAVR